MVFFSLSARILLNNEALNMVESIGNFVRHRRAPVIVPRGGGFMLRFVPAISGENIAHAYQEILAKLATDTNLPVCSNCKMGYFIKHADASVFEDWARGKKGHDLEKAIIENCIVEDIGGFMYAGEEPVRRTSRFQVGYMIPALDTLSATATEAQFHIRYSTKKELQSIYYVELGSAIYSFVFNLDVSGIGVSSFEKIEEVLGLENRKKRIEIAFKALDIMLSNAFFGAKKTRFYSSWKVLNAIAVVSHPIPIVAEPPHDIKYIERTVMKVRSMKNSLETGDLKISELTWIGYYSSGDEDASIGSVSDAEKTETLSALINRSMQKALEFLEGLKK